MLVKARRYRILVLCLALCVSILHSSASKDTETVPAQIQVPQPGPELPDQSMEVQPRSYASDITSGATRSVGKTMAELVKESALHEAAYFNDLERLRTLLRNTAPGGICREES